MARRTKAEITKKNVCDRVFQNTINELGPIEMSKLGDLDGVAETAYDACNGDETTIKEAILDAYNNLK